MAMRDAKFIDVGDSMSDDPSEMLLDVGLPEYNRRLTDKILAAFNHAYSMGESALADKIRGLLGEAEQRGRQRYPDRRAGQASAQAALWMQFVDARDRYREACGIEGADASDLSRKLEEMKEAYKNWSFS